MKIRLDNLLVRRQLSDTLSAAERLIRAGKVLVNDVLVDKPGTQVQDSCSLRIKDQRRFVSRGGLKLLEALQSFQLDPAGMICADIGVSTGGFTDCLLQNGASSVYAVDVGYGQIDWKLRQDPRVILIERFNARNITTKQIPEKIHLAVIDVSFISLTKIIPHLLPFFDQTVQIIALIKPQFELPKDKIGKGGIVKDPVSQQEAVDTIIECGKSLGLQNRGVVTSPILGAKGNREYLIYLSTST